MHVLQIDGYASGESAIIGVQIEGLKIGEAAQLWRYLAIQTIVIEEQGFQLGEVA